MATLGRLEAGKLREHPRNREFLRSGAEWEVWLGDLRANGIKQELEVRRVPVAETQDGKTEDARPEGEFYYQVIKGHRRLAGWLELGRRHPGEERYGTVPVICKEMDDAAALKELFRDNLLHETLDAVEEAKGVLSLMEDLGLSAEDVAGEISKSLEWVRTRQLVLDLGPEAQAALRLPPTEERHLHVGTVQLMLGLKAEERATALQMVLHPDFQMQTLTPRQARDAIAEVIVKPRREREAWEATRERAAKSWKTALRKLLPRKDREGLLLLALPWADAQGERACRAAEDEVPAAERTEAAPPGLLWLHLAVKHGLRVAVLPCAEHGSKAVVDEVMLRQAEAAQAEHGREVWLLKKKRPEARDQRQEETEDGQTQDARLEEERTAGVETVIEQAMERTMVIRADVVSKLREEAKAWLDEPVTMEGLTDAAAVAANDARHAAILAGWPAWAKADHLFMEDVVDICDWVLSLKYVPGGRGADRGGAEAAEGSRREGAG